MHTFIEIFQYLPGCTTPRITEMRDEACLTLSFLYFAVWVSRRRSVSFLSSGNSVSASSVPKPCSIWAMSLTVTAKLSMACRGKRRDRERRGAEDKTAEKSHKMSNEGFQQSKNSNKGEPQKSCKAAAAYCS